MSKKYLALAVIVLGGLGLALSHNGCVKGNPIGADVNNLANTTIYVSVSAGVSVKQGITVIALDPSGTQTSAITDSNGNASFNAQLPGAWTITVPTQGDFYKSSMTVNVTAGTVGPSISFTAQGQNLAVSPLTPEVYGISGANITYQITYSQPSNLLEPVSLVATWPTTQTLPSGWGAQFTPMVVGDITNISLLTIVVPQGSFQQP